MNRSVSTEQHAAIHAPFNLKSATALALGVIG
jgi:hypothetical protein